MANENDSDSDRAQQGGGLRWNRNVDIHSQHSGSVDSHPPRKPETTLLSATVVGKRKTFYIALCENDNGRFVKLTEERNSRKTSVILPEESIIAIADHLQEIAMALKNHLLVKLNRIVYRDCYPRITTFSRQTLFHPAFL